MKKYLLILMLFLSISLCGCSNGSDLATVDDTQEGIYHSQQDNMSVSELTENSEVNGLNDLEINSKLGFLMAGDMGNLGIGTLAYTVPNRDDEDYRLYFFQLGNEEDINQLLDETSFKLSEASFIFPDVRDGNAPIGIFKEIYYMDYTDISKDGSADVIVVSLYERDGGEYYDTRVYEEVEYGFIVNIELTRELNEKYYNTNDYPIGDIVILPGE